MVMNIKNIMSFLKRDNSRSQHLLEHLLLTQALRNIKTFYSICPRIHWFTNTLINFVHVSSKLTNKILIHKNIYLHGEFMKFI